MNSPNFIESTKQLCKMADATSCGNCSLQFVQEDLFAKCSRCLMCYHLSCEQTTEGWRRKTKGERDNWICDKCTKGVDHMNKVKIAGCELLALDVNATDTTTLVRAIVRHMQSVQESVNFISAEYDKVRQVQEETRKVVESQQCEIAELRKERAIMQVNYEQLRRYVGESERKYQEMLQYSYQEDVVIRNVPRQDNEDVLKIMQKIGSEVGCPIDKSDVSIGHRLYDSKVSDKPPGIVVRFTRRETKQKLIKACREKKPKVTIFGESSSTVADNRIGPKPVLVLDHLTPYYLKLFHDAKSVCKAKNWKYVWTSNCEILCRKDGEKTSRVTVIKTADDLAQIIE